MENRLNITQNWDRGKQLTFMFFYWEFLKPQGSEALLSGLSSNATSSGKLSLTAGATFPGVYYMSHDCEDYLIVSFHYERLPSMMLGT